MKGLSNIFFRFMGSMNLAITLLVAVALSSIIGTLLKQNEPYQNYIIKFGPFWHEVYQSLGLYDVYSSAWFIGILSFLVLTTSICVIQNGPGILRSIRQFRADITAQSLRTMKQHEEWLCEIDIDEAFNGLSYFFKKSGYRIRTHKSEQGYTLAAMHGASNRMGYILTHLAIIVICVGGLIDGNLPLKIKALTGQLIIEKDNNAPVSDIPESSVLDADNPSFRASVTIPEGKKVNVAFLNIADGYLVQKLPFSIEILDFRIEHYDSGQPKSFESDLVIHDPETRTSLAETISVNHPLSYKGYTIYQASFADGGSTLDMQIHQLRDKDMDSLQISGHINETLSINTGNDPLKLELDEFRLFNIFPVAEDEATNKKFRDQGPNFTFKLRKQDGSAIEFVNYMYPLMIGDHNYFLSGTRASPTDEFKYLHIPADHNDSLNRFLKFQALLRDDETIQQAAESIAKKDNISQTNEQFINATQSLISLFLSGGFEAIQTHLKTNVPEEEQDSVSEIYIKILQNTLQQVFFDMLVAEGVEITEEQSQQDIRFFQDTMLALSSMPFYQSPFYLELENFEHKQATGLQITRTPGKIYVYIGFAMLISGVFLLFYVSYQRCWIILERQGNVTRILVAGTSNRHKTEFSEKFKQMTGIIKAELKPIDN
ncbi:MAG: cytochrome c biogenesis protein [Gammaproteobacteria bacterium]|jgi:cytochrome c biogenesis protein